MMTFFILCCWVLSFFFNGIESGVLSIDPVRLRQNVKRRVPAAFLLNRLLKRPQRLLVTVLLFTNAADIVGLLLLTRASVLRYGSAGFLIALAVALPVYLFLLSVLPKALFRRFPFRALARLAGVLAFLTTLLSPLLALGAFLGRFFLPRSEKGRIFAAREELKQITAQSEREGALTSTERAMIHNVVDFRGVKVRDVMIPASKVVAVNPDSSIDEALEISSNAEVDRLPVIASDGQPRGLVNVLDMLLDKNGERSLAHYMRRMVMANDQEPAYRIVQRLRAARLGLAAVLDRERKFCGIVTIEDLVRRLVSSSEART
ncbi:MAG TPA: CNNM domain-containing protein [Chthoniobacterales bacterium]|jgi:CBS domain containing-hemolysin-like protein